MSLYIYIYLQQLQLSEVDISEQPKPEPIIDEDEPEPTPTPAQSNVNKPEEPVEKTTPQAEIQPKVEVVFVPKVAKPKKVANKINIKPLRN